MKKYILLTSLTLAAILSLTALPSLAEATRPQVEVITPLEYDFSPTVSVSGRVEEKSRAEITLPMPAVPKQLFFEVGDTVSPGDVLASLDPDAAREALLSYASRYADLLPSLSLPEELQILLHLDTAVELAERFLPLFSLNLGWILPAVLGLLIGLLCQKHQKTLQAFA